MKPYIALFLFAGIACNQPKPEGFTLKATIKGLSSGTAKLSVGNMLDRTSKVVDSATMTNGAFTLKGNAPLSEMMYVLVEPGNWSFSVFVENGAITITADTIGSTYYDYTAYHGDKGANIKHADVTGSPSHTDWQSYENDPALKAYDTVVDRIYKTMEATKNIDTEYMYRDQADSVYKLKYALQKAWITRYISTHPSSGVGLYLFTDYYQFNGDMSYRAMDSVLNVFSDTLRTTPYYIGLTALSAQKRGLSPGSMAPDFTLLKKDSSQFTLSSTRGHYVMLDFWASWCHPCRKAIPHWKEAYQRYHPKGFEMVSVTDDNVWKSWFKAMDEEKMPWTQVADEFPLKNMPARVATLYMSHYIPFYMLLDPTGKIVLYNPSEQEMDKKLSELFDTHLQ